MNAETLNIEPMVQPPEAKKVKILIVDDQPENLLSAEAVLESLRQEIVRAQSGREALRHCFINRAVARASLFLAVLSAEQNESTAK